MRRKRTKPNKVDLEATQKLRELARESGILPAEGYTIWVTNTQRGQCSYTHRWITVPLWSFAGPPAWRGLPTDSRYVLYYLAHECAHSFMGWAAHHGPAFQAALQRLCPPDVVHYEHNYKPRHAARAGIPQRKE